MLIETMLPKGKTRTVIELEDGGRLVLSNRDIAQYDLREGGELPEVLYSALRRQMRQEALRKCSALLENMDYTSHMLKDRLLRSGYPEDIAGEAVDAMRNAGYVDDLRYAGNFIRAHGPERSRLRLHADLAKRGIPEAETEKALSAWEAEVGETAQEIELRQIHELLYRYHYDQDGNDPGETYRIMSLLRRRGYPADTIRRAVRSYTSLS